MQTQLITLFHRASDLRNNLAQLGIVSLISILERELNHLPHSSVYILTGWYCGTEHSYVCCLPDISESASAEQSSWCIFKDTFDCWSIVTHGQGAATNTISKLWMCTWVPCLSCLCVLGISYGKVLPVTLLESAWVCGLFWPSPFHGSVIL